MKSEKGAKSPKSSAPNRTLAELMAKQYFVKNLLGLDKINLKSNEDMILALAEQFKQLSHEPEKFRLLNGIRTHDLCDAGAVL